MEAIKSFRDFIAKFRIIEALSNVQIEHICEELEIKNFKGVFMRDELNKNGKVASNECLVLNIDHSENRGTHWVCLYVDKDVYYFDSYGFPPPLEVIDYCRNNSRRLHNTFRIQKPNEVICGHYCIYMLYRLSNGSKFLDVLGELYKYNH